MLLIMFAPTTLDGVDEANRYDPWLSLETSQRAKHGVACQVSVVKFSFRCQLSRWLEAASCLHTRRC